MRQMRNKQNETMCKLPSAFANNKIVVENIQTGNSPKSQVFGMANTNNSMNIMKVSPNNNSQMKNKVDMNTLSKFSSTIKTDMRKQGSPFRFLTKNPTSSLESYQSRRTLGNGRINKAFKMTTP